MFRASNVSGVSVMFLRFYGTFRDFRECSGSFWKVSAVDMLRECSEGFREFLEGFGDFWHLSSRKFLEYSGSLWKVSGIFLAWAGRFRPTASSADPHVGPTAAYLRIGPPPLPPTSTSGHRLFRRTPHRPTAGGRGGDRTSRHAQRREPRHSIGNRFTSWNFALPAPRKKIAPEGMHGDETCTIRS